MSWVRVDDKFMNHPKVIRAGMEAIGLWLLTCCWSSAYETDGHLPADILEALPGYRKPLANRLVLVGLWEQIDGGFQIHDYLDFNPSAAEQRSKRAATAERVRTSRRRNTVTNAAVTGESRGSNSAPIPSRSRPVPSPVEQGKTPVPAGAHPAPAQQDLITAPRKASSKSTATASAYSDAYEDRYGLRPPRNAKMNAQFCRLVDLLGAEDAPLVAAYYLTRGDALYVNSSHCVDLLVRDYHKLSTERQTGMPVTPTTARQNEATAGNAAWQYAQELRRKEESK